jgi:hypothetical protein
MLALCSAPVTGLRMGSALKGPFGHGSSPHLLEHITFGSHKKTEAFERYCGSEPSRDAAAFDSFLCPDVLLVNAVCPLP